MLTGNSLSGEGMAYDAGVLDRDCQTHLNAWHVVADYAGKLPGCPWPRPFPRIVDPNGVDADPVFDVIAGRAMSLSRDSRNLGAHEGLKVIDWVRTDHLGNSAALVTLVGPFHDIGAGVRSLA